MEELNHVDPRAEIAAALEQVKLHHEAREYSMAEAAHQPDLPAAGQQQEHAVLDQPQAAVGASTSQQVAVALPVKAEIPAACDMQVDQQGAWNGVQAAAVVQGTDPAHSPPQLAHGQEGAAAVQVRRLSSGDKRIAADYCPMSNLEALVAACELAAEREGIDSKISIHCHQQEVVAESPGASNKSAGTGTHFLAPTAAVPIPSRAHHGHGHSHGAHGHGHSYSPMHGKGAGSGAHFTGAGSVPERDSRRASVCEDYGAGAMAFGLGPDGLPKYRRHKSKVFIRPNKVVYLPTTFMEENFDAASLPLNCEMVVEADGMMVPGETHHVTIKAVPRQGLSTMFCMTNVMKFQQQYLNWQILNWTKLDNHHIKIHLQGPNSPTPPMYSSTAVGSAPATQPFAATAGATAPEATSPRVSRLAPGSSTSAPFAAASSGHRHSATPQLPGGTGWVSRGAAGQVDRPQQQLEQGQQAAAGYQPGGAAAMETDAPQRGGRGAVRPDAAQHQHLLHALSTELGRAAAAGSRHLDVPAPSAHGAGSNAPALPVGSPTAGGLHKRVHSQSAFASNRMVEADAAWEAAARMVGAMANGGHWTPIIGHRGPHITAHAHAPTPIPSGMAVAGSPHGLYFVVNNQRQGSDAATATGAAGTAGDAAAGVTGMCGPNLTQSHSDARPEATNAGAAGGPRCIVTHACSQLAGMGMGVGGSRADGNTTPLAQIAGSLFAAGHRTRSGAAAGDGGAANGSWGSADAAAGVSAEPRMVGPSSGSNISAGAGGTGSGSDCPANSGRSSSFGPSNLLELDTPTPPKGKGEASVAGAAAAAAQAAAGHASPAPYDPQQQLVCGKGQQGEEVQGGGCGISSHAPLSAFKRYKPGCVPLAITGNGGSSAPAAGVPSSQQPVQGQPMLPVLCAPWASGLFLPGFASALAPFLSMHAMGGAAPQGGAGSGCLDGCGPQSLPPGSCSGSCPASTFDVAAAAARASANASSCLLALIASGLGPLQIAAAAQNPAFASLLNFAPGPGLPPAGAQQQLQQQVGNVAEAAAVAQYLAASEAHSRAIAAAPYRT